MVQIVASLALIPLAGMHGTGAFAAVLALLVLIGVARAFRAPASMSLLPLLVPADDYVRASSISSAIRQVAIVGGPALGGVLVAAGADVAYGTAIAAYAVGALGVLAIPIVLRAPARPTFDWKAAFAGIAFLRGEPVVAGAITLDLFAVLFGGATALLPIYAAQIFHTGAVGFGMLRASVAVGTALMALVLARRPIHRFAGPRLLASVAVFGAATIAFGLSRSLPVALVALAVLGAADMVSMAVRDALVALRTPDAMRGRVSALEGVFIVASNELGEFESGTLASFVGAVPAVVFGGAATIAVVALWTWRNAALRRADALVPPG
jgi:MFS family permease